MTTLTLEKAIASAAKVGFKKPWVPKKKCKLSGTPFDLNRKYMTPAAMGIKTILYMKAQKKLPHIV